jgi:branched-chain amino acid transport system ATP-binding protein
MTVLQVEGVDTAYGAVRVNHGVSLTVGAGEIVTIIGPNGAGKTTILRAISGLLRPGAGRIRFDGEDVTGTPADRMAALGVVMSPEGRRIFADLTVRENLRLGAYVRRDAAGIEADIERMEATFPILAQKRRQKGGTLSGGQQQMLAIARGLMAKPKVLILDEPSLGLAPVVVKEVRQVIRDVRDTFGAAVLLVEQNASLALAVAERGYLMQHGRIVAEGTIEKLRGTALMRELYFGDSRATETV